MVLAYFVQSVLKEGACSASYTIVRQTIVVIWQAMQSAQTRLSVCRPAITTRIMLSWIRGTGDHNPLILVQRSTCYMGFLDSSGETEEELADDGLRLAEVMSVAQVCQETTAD